MYKIAPICLALIATVAALPQGGPPFGGDHHEGDKGRGGPDEPGRTDYLSTFEDYDDDALGNDIGPYNGLFWENMAVDVADTLLGGIKAQSPPNVAIADAIDASISTQYPGSVTDIFDLHRFYFACSNDVLVVGGLTPTDCTLTVTGYRASQQIARQSIRYFAAGGTLLSGDAPMRRFTLNNFFKGVDTVRFDVDSLDEVDSIIIDNVQYTTYNADLE